MDRRVPLVSIGLPTYNGGRYLAQSLDALLKQDCADWELVISDNCSTDDTEAISRDYAGRSDRIRYVRHETNLGAMANFNLTLNEATGVYFMWAADHDLWEPTFISRCVGALEADPAAVLAYPLCRMIDESGAGIEEIGDPIDFSVPSALYRYKHLLWGNIASKIYGLGRREAMAAAGGFPDVQAPDRLFLVRLALQGPFEKVDDYLYIGRQNRAPETVQERHLRTLKDLNPEQAGQRAVLPGTRLYRELRDLYMAAIDESSLSFREKLEARVATLFVFHMRYHVASNLVRVLRVGGKVTRQTARLEHWLGKAD